VFGVEFRRVSATRRYLQQFYALLIKHVIHSLRNKYLTVAQIILPVVFTIIACVIEKIIVAPGDPPALTLNLNNFNDPIISSTSVRPLTSFPAAISLQESYGKVASEWGQWSVTDDTDMNNYLVGVASTSIDKFTNSYIIAGELATDVI
jgi:hypothetical protein